MGLNVVVLEGKWNSGKTSSLKYLILNVLNWSGISVEYVSRYSAHTPDEVKEKIQTSWHTLGGAVSDLSIVVRYKEKRIAITSYGDSFKDEIAPFLGKVITRFGKCDVFVCGRHKRNNPAMEFAAYSPKVKIVKKERVPDSKDYDNANKQTGKELFEEMQSLLKE